MNGQRNCLACRRLRFRTTIHYNHFSELAPAMNPQPRNGNTNMSSKFLFLKKFSLLDILNTFLSCTGFFFFFFCIHAPLPIWKIINTSHIVGHWFSNRNFVVVALMRENAERNISSSAPTDYILQHIDDALNLFAVSAYTRGYRKSFVNSTLYLTLLWRQSFALVFPGLYNRNA